MTGTLVLARHDWNQLNFMGLGFSEPMPHWMAEAVKMSAGAASMEF